MSSGGGGLGQPLSSPRYVSQLYVIPAVDAAEAGKGQLEISVNQGQVPNNVQMQDAGRCLVTFIPQHSGTYVIDVTFNGLQVHGCPIEVDVRERQVGKTGLRSPSLHVLRQQPTTSPPALSEFHKAREVPYAPLDQRGLGIPNLRLRHSPVLRPWHSEFEALAFRI
uniref:Filamin-A n=1 Tax=Globodera pallida TaxID=36090 RepID=A0A183CGQ2_GLOPA